MHLQKYAISSLDKKKCFDEDVNKNIVQAIVVSSFCHFPLIMQLVQYISTGLGYIYDQNWKGKSLRFPSI